jgi:hypothetical protein
MTYELALVPHTLVAKAKIYLQRKDILGVLCLIGNDRGLDFVSQNVQALKADGLFETALVEAFTACRVNNNSWPLPVLRSLFCTIADRKKLRLIGPPLTSAGPFRLYRGVAGRGVDRRTAGISWTANLNAACWFAMRFADVLEEPAVYEYMADESEVLCRHNERNEDEYLLDVSHPKLVNRMELSLADMQRRATLWQSEDRSEAKAAEAQSG